MNSDAYAVWAPRMLAVLRIMVALLFIEHGSQKLFGFPPSDRPGPELVSLLGLAGVLEFFGGLWPAPVVKTMVRNLKALQDVLGTHQDREVQADHLRALADELAGVVGGPEALLVLGVLVDRLGAAQHAARDDFAARFSAFAAPSQRKLVSATFRGPSG